MYTGPVARAWPAVTIFTTAGLESVRRGWVPCADCSGDGRNKPAVVATPAAASGGWGWVVGPEKAALTRTSP